MDSRSQPLRGQWRFHECPRLLRFHLCPLSTQNWPHPPRRFECTSWPNRLPCSLTLVPTYLTLSVRAQLWSKAMEGCAGRRRRGGDKPDMKHDNNLDLSGLSNRPIPWRVYEFFYQRGGRIDATPMGIIAAFVEESDAKTFAKGANDRQDLFSYRSSRPS